MFAEQPDRGATSRADIERVIGESAGVVIVDEAYGEFADDTFAGGAPSYANTLVLRTLSKAFGLAGLRVGYAVGAPALIEMVRKARGPYRVSGPSERAATAALTADIAWMNSAVAEARAVRTRFTSALRDAGFAPLPSQGNFVCVPTKDARAIADRIAKRGIAARVFPGLRGIGDALRITLAPWPVMERVVAAMGGGPA